MKKRFLSIFLSLTLTASMLAGCGNTTAPAGEQASVKEETQSPVQKEETASESKYEKFITVDVFDGQANYQGIQSGWFAEVVKQKFNMELNIIAPNVAGGGETLYQTRSAAGDLGDLIILTCAGGKLQDLVTAGLVIDMTDMLPGHENILKYKGALDYTEETMCTIPGIYAVPSEVSERAATEPLGGTELNSGHYLRWDLYKQLGYPEMKTWDDLLNVMRDMQDLCPTSDSGKPTYAFSLFADWDGDYMNAASYLAAYEGIGVIGYAMQRADNRDPSIGILDDNSSYMEGLEFFFKANQMGLLDPESTSQNYDTLSNKYKDGQILYSTYPWLGQAAYNTQNHLDEGKGFDVAVMEGNEFYDWGCYSKGNPNNAIMIGSQAEDPERLMDFIDWLYSPEGICLSTGQTSGSCGIKDLMWTMENGAPALTDFGLQCYTTSETPMPAEYGGGNFADGISQLNYKTVSDGEINPETGFPYNITLWDSFNSMNVSDIHSDWQEHYGAKNSLEYFMGHDMVVVSPGSGFAGPSVPTDIENMRSQIREIVKDYSWRAVFAETREEYDAIVAEMKSIAEGLGYEEVLAYDISIAELEKEAREAVSK